VGSAPSGLDTSPDGKTLYVANSGGNNISVVDVIQGIEKFKVPVPAGFSDDRPFSLAVANNGLVLFSTTFAGSGFGGRMLQLDPSTNTVSQRLDFFAGGSTTEATFLRPSGDRSAVGAVAGDISSAPVFKYLAAANLWGPEKDLGGFVAFIALDQTGATTLVNPGTYVLDANLNLAGTIPGGSFGVAVDPAGAIGYQVGPARIDVLKLANFTKTDSLDVGDTLVNASAFGSRVGELAISRDGGILAVITDHGFSIVRTKVSRFVSFAAISAEAHLRLREEPKSDSFRVEGIFTLDGSSNGIDPLSENATLQVGSVTLSIPAGTLQASGHEFKFAGIIDGVAVKISLHARSNNRYHFVAHGDGVDLSGTSIPLNVSWVIGDDRGSVKLNKGEAELH
jgi:YVTN family beta-propeller protein